MEVILQGSTIKNIHDFHKQLKVLLDLPDYYGENLDALWDCLTAWVETPLTLVWKDFEMSKVYLGEYSENCLVVFRKAEKEVDGFKLILE